LTEVHEKRINIDRSRNRRTYLKLLNLCNGRRVQNPTAFSALDY